MFINELNPNAKIALYVLVGCEQLTFSTKVCTSPDKKVEKLLKLSHSCLAEPISVDGKIISFSDNPEISYVAQSYHPSAEKMMEWQSVVPRLIKDANGKKYLMISCATPSKFINRRKRFRIWVGLPTVASFGLSTQTSSVVIKDLSACGFAIIMSGDTSEYTVGGLARVVLADQEASINMTLPGIIVRKEELEDGRTLVGCKLNHEYPELERYILEKERARLKTNRGKITDNRPALSLSGKK